MKKQVLIVVVIVLAAAGLIATILITTSGRSSMDDMGNMSSTDTAAISADAVSTNSVSISNFAFSPAVIKVKKGTKVTWTNTDDVKHSVTADEGSKATLKSDLFAKDGTYSYTFDNVGTFSYHCEPHPYMHGTVIVE